MSRTVLEQAQRNIDVMASHLDAVERGLQITEKALGVVPKRHSTLLERVLVLQRCVELQRPVG